MEIKTAEYVRRGHPDRVCDIIADSLLDEFVKQDPMSRVAIEVFGCHGIITVGGEVTTNGYVDIQKVVKDVYKEIGYKENIGVQVNIAEQSREISDLADLGAGDSGIMIGYATNETKEMLPLELALAKRICDELDNNKDLLPDGKAQVTIKNGLVSDVVVAYQSDFGFDNTVRNLILKIIEGICKPDINIKIIRFNIGGFDADTGLTGRKNVIWYGPSIPIGGGAFAGKDATKVDRTGAYLARKIAVDHIKTGVVDKCLVEVAYSMGDPEPIDVMVNGEEWKMSGIGLSELIDKMGLRTPIFKGASLKGHFGAELNWEK